MVSKEESICMLFDHRPLLLAELFKNILIRQKLLLPNSSARALHTVHSFESHYIQCCFARTDLLLHPYIQHPNLRMDGSQRSVEEEKEFLCFLRQDIGTYLMSKF